MNKLTKVMKKLSAKAKDLFKTLCDKKAKLTARLTAGCVSTLALAVTAFAEDEEAEPGDAQFMAVINFFATWIGRIGLIVGFVGAIMFALAIKNDDADAKTRGLMTLASGFVVFAVTKAVDMFVI